jgi:hypothetical protein
MAMKKIITRALVVMMAFLGLSTTTTFAATPDEDSDLLVAILKEIVNTTNDELPSEIEDGMVLNKLSLNDTRLIFDYLVDDETYAAIKASMVIMDKEEATMALMEGILESDDGTMYIFLAFCAEAGRGVEFRFSDFSREGTVKFYITQYDIKYLLDDDIDIYSLLEELM